MLIETGAQVAALGRSRGFARRDRYIDRRQGVLVQAKRFPCQAFDAIALDGVAESARRNAQTEARIAFTIGQNRETEKRIGEFFAAPLHVAKFGRRVQTLARLEVEFTDR